MTEQLDLLALLPDRHCRYGWTPEQRNPQDCDKPAAFYLHWAIDLLAGHWLFWPGHPPQSCYGRGFLLCARHAHYYGSAWESHSQLTFIRPLGAEQPPPNWPVTGWKGAP